MNEMVASMTGEYSRTNSKSVLDLDKIKNYHLGIILMKPNSTICIQFKLVRKFAKIIRQPFKSLKCIFLGKN